MTLTPRGRALATFMLLAVATPAAAVTPHDRLTPTPPITIEPSAPRGVFDIVLEAEGAPPVAAKILVEQRGARVEVTLIVDQRVSAMHVVRSDARSLQASVPTTDGAGQMSLRFDGDAVGGTLTAKKHAWKVTGTRSL